MNGPQADVLRRVLAAQQEVRDNPLANLGEIPRRGELFFMVAASYVQVRRDRIEQDPDLRVREAIDKEANWLPAPTGPIYVVMRLLAEGGRAQRILEAVGRGFVHKVTSRRVFRDHPPSTASTARPKRGAGLCVNQFVVAQGPPT